MAADAGASYYGAYINLDRSSDRRARMDSQLASFGLRDRYSRFAAIDGTRLVQPVSALRPGETGAFHSHMGVLERLRPRGTALHILEDDAVLSPHVRPVIEDAIRADVFDRYDLLFTDTFLAPHLGMYKGLKAVFDQFEATPRQALHFSDLTLIDLTGQNFSCLTSYVVGPAAIDRLLALYRGATASAITKPVDLLIRDCVQAGQLRAAVLFPFITSFHLEDVAGSTIVGAREVSNPSVTVLAVLRYLFFVERDLKKAKLFLDAATKENRRPINPHHEMMSQALEFIVSADFQEF